MIDKATFQVRATICALSSLLVLASIIGYLAGLFSDRAAFLIFLVGFCFLLPMLTQQRTEN